MTRIALFTSSLSAGGAERILSCMANHWAARGIDTTLVTIDSPLTDFYAVDVRVRRVGLNLLRPSRGLVDALRTNLQRMLALRRFIQTTRPDALISFSDRNNALALLAATITGIPVIVSERNDPRHLPNGRAWSTLRRVLYPFASSVVVQTESVASWARAFVRPHRVHVIPNFVTLPFQEAPPLERTARVMLAMGRLERQKGFDLLLRAFARCGPELEGWRLEIAGEGSERRSLEKLAHELGIRHRVALLGRVRDTERLFHSCAIFVLSSRYEGFPNVLLEAMAAGRAVAAFDCPSGPADIVRDGIDGLLVPAGDVDKLANALLRLGRDSALRARLGNAARGVKARFSIECVMPLWERLLFGGGAVRCDASAEESP